MALVNIVFILCLLLPTLQSALLEYPCLSQGEETTEVSLKQVACSNIKDPDSCLSRLESECQRNGHHLPLSMLHAAIRGTVNEAIQAIDEVSKLGIVTENVREQTAIRDCIELLDYTVSELGWSLAEMGRMQLAPANLHREGNLGAWLSAALGNQDTCLEGFEGTDGRLKHYVGGSLTQVTQLVSNLLSMYKRMESIVPLKPDLNGTRGIEGIDSFRPWLTDEEQELAWMNPRKMSFDAVVASDGSGRHQSVMEAVNHAPDHSTRRYIILVKRGVYRENVELKKKKTNIMLVGEGMGVTVISGSRSFMDGWTTFRTATFAVSGQGFIARDITFRNTAGPQRNQAVALRVDSDRSAFFRCSIEGFQDTLYAHSLRQFYRECNIYGTIDFIFGNANAVLQRCKIFTRKPLPYQKVTITAQGRKDPAQTTGFSIHDSYVLATYPTYLGRPWKQYSRTVYMQSYLSAQVQPAGWLQWAGNFALNTLYYGEYRNYGPGSSLNGRIRWPGYQIIRDAAVASFFTVRRFIDGASWLPATRVPFTADLIK